MIKYHAQFVAPDGLPRKNPFGFDKYFVARLTKRFDKHLKVSRILIRFGKGKSKSTDRNRALEMGPNHTRLSTNVVQQEDSCIVIVGQGKGRPNSRGVSHEGIDALKLNKTTRNGFDTIQKLSHGDIGPLFNQQHAIREKHGNGLRALTLFGIEARLKWAGEVGAVVTPAPGLREIEVEFLQDFFFVLYRLVKKFHTKVDYPVFRLHYRASWLLAPRVSGTGPEGY